MDTDEGWLNLAGIKDLFNKKIVGRNYAHPRNVRTRVKHPFLSSNNNPSMTI